MTATASQAMSVSATATAGNDIQSGTGLIQVRAMVYDGRNFAASAGASYDGFPRTLAQLSASTWLGIGSRYFDDASTQGAQVQWSFADSFVLTAPGVEAGTRGTLTAAVQLVPFFALSGTVRGVVTPTQASGWVSSGAWETSADIRSHDGSSVIGQAHQDLAGRQTADSQGHASNTSSGRVFEVTIPVSFGQPVDLELHALLKAQTNLASEALVRTEGVAVSSLELRWGFIGLTTDDGIDVPSFNGYSPTSGWNYAVALVPEPANAMMLVLGLLALGGRHAGFNGRARGVAPTRAPATRPW